MRPSVAARRPGRCRCPPSVQRRKPRRAGRHHPADCVTPGLSRLPPGLTLTAPQGAIPMRVGLAIHGAGGLTFDAWLEGVTTAEQLGFPSVFISDDFFVGKPRDSIEPYLLLTLAWAAAGAAVGGGATVHTDGIDFNLLEPAWFAILLFVAIPGSGAGLIAWLVEAMRAWWWKRWWPTCVAGGAGLPVVVLSPALAIIVVVGAASIGMARANVRAAFIVWRPTRIAAVVVFAGVVAAGTFDLVRDAGELL